MKRLIKKSVHDVMNRDNAFLYINGKYYEDSTHALCLYDYFTEKGQKNKAQSYQYRPSMDIFYELSEEVGPVVLGHMVEKEDGVFVIYACLDGEAVYFNDIPKNLIDEISKHYGMECYDDLEHDETKSENLYNADEKSKEFNERKNEVSSKEAEKAAEYLESNGFNTIGSGDNKYYTNGTSINIIIEKDDNSVTYYEIGEGLNYYYTNKIEDITNEVPEFYSKVTSYGGTCKSESLNKFTCEFNNTSGTIHYELYQDIDESSEDIVLDEKNLSEEMADQIASELWNQFKIDTYKLKTEDLDALYNYEPSENYVKPEVEETKDVDIDNDINLDDFINNLFK